MTEKQALTTILKIGSDMLMNQISGDMTEWDLPKTTPKSVKKKIIKQVDGWNEINRIRAIELKKAYDILKQTTP